MKLSRLLLAAALLTCGLFPLRAQVPQIINYQGKVTVGATPFTGTGQFRFALVNGTGTTSYWSNDGTSNAGSQPTAAVALPVVNGLYFVPLGDTTLAGMTAVPASVFANSDVRLRVWFDDETNGAQLLAPDQRITSVGYAMVAGTVPDRAITSAKLAPNIAVSGTVQAGTFVGDGSQLSGLVTGSVFVRWGNATAPAGTTLLYSGIAFSDYYSHTASAPIVLAANDPGETMSGSPGALLYPMATASTGAPMPTGIVADKVLKGAVCYAPRPTTVIWGTWTAPSGWTVLYKGYSMGSHYTHPGGLPPICVDENLDTSLPVPGGSTTRPIYATRPGYVPSGMGYTANTFVKCAVVMKNP